MPVRLPPVTELCPGVLAPRVRKVLRSEPGGVLVPLSLAMRLGNGHPELDKLEKFTQARIDEALQKLGFSEDEIIAAKLVAGGVATLS